MTASTIKRLINAVRSEFENKDVITVSSSAYDKSLSMGSSMGSIHSALDSSLTDMILPTKHCVNVGFFMQEAGQEIPDVVSVPSEDVRRLRARMTLEEALETIEALGFTLKLGDVEIKDQGKDLELVATTETLDAYKIAKECLDCHVIATGTLLSMGIPLTEDLLLEVDTNNLVKFRKDKDGHLREDGKWVKPSDHPAARIQLVVQQNLRAHEEFLADYS